MKPKILISLCAACLLMSACGEKQQPDAEPSAPTSTETSTEAPTVSTSTEAPAPSVSTEDWVHEAKFSKNQKYHFPWLNEEVFGADAEKFNAEIKEIYEEISYSYEDVSYNEQYAELTTYETFTDPETGTFSVVFQFPFLRKFMGYRSAVFDVASRKKLSFSDFLSRYDFTKEEAKESVLRYHESHYNSAAEDFGYEELVDFDEYMEGRLNDYTAQVDGKPDESVGEHYDIYYGLSDGKPSIYVNTLDPQNYEPFASTKYSVPIHLRKPLANFALANATSNSAAALIELPSTQDIAYAKPLQTIDTEHASSKDAFLLIATKDNVQAEIHALSYDENKGEIKLGDAYYSGTLQKGQSLLIHAIVPEGIPYVQLDLSYKETYSGTEYTFRAKKVFYFNGAFPNPKIEYLEGRDNPEGHGE